MNQFDILSTKETINSALETWFIQNVLFKGSSYRSEFDNEIIADSAVLIYLALGAIDLNLVNKVNFSKKLVLYHMGDERLDKDISAYASCNLVIRNYYFKEIINSSSTNIIWAPNGFRTSVGPRSMLNLRRSNSRSYLAAFLGWISNSTSYQNERTKFFESAKTCGGNLYFLPTNNFGGGYNIGLYSAVMEDAIFAPCPAGNSPENIRLYDALEVGCIPISLAHEFLFSEDALALIGPVPFPILSSWEDLPKFLSEMKGKRETSPQYISDLQFKCISWWSSYKVAIATKISTYIQRL
ncbi:hypothetical protein AOC10_06170 [Polynucleobacter asymbioticus]|uniref:exostosin domain-containing protein n=1 Tax=Polynucleobacter asymbioticus TaxID=576611 RepID=UPI0008FB6B7B|nr:exostosin family protein [Polynucleobacter asymbioticus]APC06135.1 hypothetical protein AOC10_06170 [Polynucleobacter asymbioticus]